VAQIFYGRGQINEALKLWWRAEEMKDSTVDGVACQAMLMSPSATNETLLAAQKKWAARHALPANLPTTSSWKRLDGYTRIRVGYFCSFLDTDTIRFQLIQALRHRNREKFEVYGYSPSRASSDIVSGFDRFRVTGAISDKAFVELVRSDEIDVFVELSGFSPQHRFTAMAARCAPVQVSYLNHTGTSGVPNVDYILADNVCVLPEEDHFFTEKVWRLPDSFFCFDYDSANTPEVAPPPSLSNGFITFCCFGSGGKINRQLIRLWSEIIARVPDSVLFIRNSQASKPDNRRYLEDRFRYYGIASERLRILGGTDRQGILRCYADADISLDTWPYCGGNTIAESIWQGVPVISLKGNRFSSRYGSSLIMAAGCPELVAETPEQYVDVAARLAQSPDRLNYYRANLRNMARKHGLSDAKRFASSLESAYMEMLRNAGIQTH
jgi:predicted O-linked N-acetylglucosamine transferase (SPINDLY family)